MSSSILISKIRAVIAVNSDIIARLKAFDKYDTVTTYLDCQISLECSEGGVPMPKFETSSQTNSIIERISKWIYLGDPLETIPHPLFKDLRYEIVDFLSLQVVQENLSLAFEQIIFLGDEVKETDLKAILVNFEHLQVGLGEIEELTLGIETSLNTSKTPEAKELITKAFKLLGLCDKNVKFKWSLKYEETCQENIVYNLRNQILEDFADLGVKSPHIKSLDLSKKDYESIPDNIRFLRNLRSLCLNNNDLRILPDSICELKRLKSLDISDNLLRGLPTNIGNLVCLESLSMNNNRLHWNEDQYLFKFPDSLGGLKNLKVLHLNKNRFDKIPRFIGELKNLEELYLNDNHIQCIPSFIGELKNLRELHLKKNRMTCIPGSVGLLDNLVILNVKKNKISDISPDIEKLINLKILHLDRNHFRVFPEEVANLKNLEILSLNGNESLSCLSENITNMTNLKKLSLIRCMITEIPENILSLSKLEEFDISHCEEKDIIISSKMPSFLKDKVFVKQHHKKSRRGF